MKTEAKRSRAVSQEPFVFPEIQGDDLSRPTLNRLLAQDRAVHDWYRFVLSFPAHLVRDYLNQWAMVPGNRVLDPFSGTGSTLIEAKKMGLHSLGIEANPLTHFAAQTKLDWSPNPDTLICCAEQIGRTAQRVLDNWGDEPLLTLPEEAMSLLLSDCISLIPLHKILVLRQVINDVTETSTVPIGPHLRLALAKTAVSTASNLRFGPEVGVTAKKKTNAPVIENWLESVKAIGHDLMVLADTTFPDAMVKQGDARDPCAVCAPNSIDAVFTSPPYPNEKDYSRATRLEMVLLGFAANKAELQSIKKGLLRSNTRNVYKGDADDQYVTQFPMVQNIANEIERRRIDMGKTSGFEKLYAKVTKLYFGGMARHLGEMRPLLRTGAYLGYVVGDQSSYLRVPIRTGVILAEIAQSLGYELVRIDLFRTRFATATKEMMREEVVVLRWKG